MGGDLDRRRRVTALSALEAALLAAFEAALNFADLRAFAAAASRRFRAAWAARVACVRVVGRPMAVKER